MIRIVISAVLTLCLSSCSSGPEPIHFGQDNCHLCKMTLMDNKFGAELVTKKGKVYKFDDMRCLINYLGSGYEREDEFAHKMVINFANPGNLIDVDEALFLASPEIRSPMNGHVAAFLSKEESEALNKQVKGEYLSWNQLSTHFD